MNEQGSGHLTLHISNHILFFKQIAFIIFIVANSSIRLEWIDPSGQTMHILVAVFIFL